MMLAQSLALAFVLTSSAFRNGDVIPKTFTADGKDVSPALAWSGMPAKTAELALIVDDPDAPSRTPWVHWVLYHVNAGATSSPEAGAPAGAAQGKNSWGTVGYRGPQPPPGKWHHYHFKLYALDAAVTVPPEATKEQLLAAMKGHVLGETELVGRYER